MRQWYVEMIDVEFEVGNECRDFAAVTDTSSEYELGILKLERQDSNCLVYLTSMMRWFSQFGGIRVTYISDATGFTVWQFLRSSLVHSF
jgi:hypothetical protein